MRGVIFDLDHTLYDRYGTISALSERLCKQLHCTVSSCEFTRIWTDIDKKYTYVGWEKVYEELTKAGIFSTPPGFDNYKNFLRECFADVSIPFDFTIPTLRRLQEMGYKTGLITNGVGRIQNSKVRNLGIAPYLDEVILCGDFGIEKPNTEPFLEMAKRLNCKPNELIYVGDNPYNDIEASEKAGYTPVWVKTTGTWRDDKEYPQYQIENVSQIFEVLKKIEKR